MGLVGCEQEPKTALKAPRAGTISATMAPSIALRHSPARDTNPALMRVTEADEAQTPNTHGGRADKRRSKLATLTPKAVLRRRVGPSRATV